MNIAVYVILIVALVAMLVMPYFTQKKRNQEYMNMLSAIKVGDLVKTAGGIIGRVNKISDKGEIKTIVLETGSKTDKSYLEMDMSMIYCVLTKSSKPNEPVKENIEVLESADEQTKAEDVEEVVDAAEPENKPETEKKARKPRTSAKTSSKSKTSKK